LGEGFDDVRLDTVFLTVPISWHGTLSYFLNMPDRCTGCTVRSKTAFPPLPFGKLEGWLGRLLAGRYH
jgi:hypothetical protein